MANLAVGAAGEILQLITCKIEPNVAGVEVLSCFFGFDDKVWGLLQLFGLAFAARLLNRVEVGFVLIELAIEAAFLKREVREIFAEGDGDFGLQEMSAANGVGFIGEDVGGEFALADGIEGCFERGDTEETPFGIGDELDESAFFVVPRGVFVQVALDMSLVDGGVFAGQEDGAAGEPGFHGVPRRYGFAFGGNGPGGMLRVGAIGSEFGIADVGDVVGVGGCIGGSVSGCDIGRRHGASDSLVQIKRPARAELCGPETNIHSEGWGGGWDFRVGERWNGCK